MSGRDVTMSVYIQHLIDNMVPVTPIVSLKICDGNHQ
jgi:hypothetical protein